MRAVIFLGLLSLAVGYNNGVSEKPPLGWNTWCTMGTCGQGGVSPGKMSLHDVCNDTEIRSVAAALISSGLHNLGYNRINLDDCWVGIQRTGDGRITHDPSRFPNGMKPLIDWLHAKGLKFGLYSSMGTTTCNNHGRSWPDNATGTWPRGGSYGHYKEDAQTFADWGVDYVKMDWCGKHPESSEVLHRNFSHWMNATGRPMHLELCRGYKSHPIPDYVREVANSWRVAGDNWDYWPHTANTIRDFINVSHLAGPYNWNYGDFLMTGGAGCNVFEAGQHCPGQSDAEYRTQFAVYAIAASPLIIGTDIRNMTNIMKFILLNEELLAVNQDYLAKAGDLVGTYSGCGSICTNLLRFGHNSCSVRLEQQLSHHHACTLGTSFGCFENHTMWTDEGCRGDFVCDGVPVRCNKTGNDMRHYCSCSQPSPPPDEILLWARHMSDKSIVIGVTNLGAATKTVNVPLSALGWSSTQGVTVRDLYVKQDLPAATGVVKVLVASHDTAVYKLILIR